MNQPFLQTKLHMPPNLPGLIMRPRLLQQLNEKFANESQFQRKLTLVSAPPGFAKTTVIAGWLSQRLSENGRSSAWLSLDSADNDLSRFYLYIVAALQTIVPEFGQVLLNMLAHSQTVAVENVMPLLVNEITAVKQPMILVLDDFHSIDQSTIHQSVEFLLTHQPPHFHLVIITRADPPFNLARWRGQRQMVELRVKDLQFTRSEIAQFVQQEKGLTLSETDLNLLETHTEGWVTGLQLAALSWRGVDDVSAVIAQFGGEDRYIVDYLLEEVLQRQSQAVQQFLLCTSILDRLNGRLCDYILENKVSFSQSILEQLESDNLFIITLDNQRTWFRYHHLFADLLRQRLAQRSPDKISHYHLRASQWFAEEGSVEEAVSHALAAQAYESAAKLLAKNRRLLWWEQHRSTSLWHWLEELPDTFIKADPSLAIMLAWLYLTIFDDWPQLEAWLQHVRASLPMVVLPKNERVELQVELNLLEAILNRKQGHIDEAIQNTVSALTPMPIDDIKRSSVLSTLGFLYEEQGNVPLAVDTHFQSLESAQQTEHIYMIFVSIARLIELLLAQGDLQLANKLFSEFSTEHERFGGAGLGTVFISFGELLRQRNELVEAENYLQKGIALCQPHSAWAVIQIIGLISLAWVRQAKGDSESARVTIQVACQLDPGVYFYNTARPEAQQAHLQLVQGDVQEAIQWAEKSGLSVTDPPNYLYEIDYLILARVLLAEGKVDDALALLAVLQEAAQTGGRRGRLIEVLILQAISHEQNKDRLLALATMNQAVTMAAPEGYMRLFLDEGEAVNRLLQQVGGQGIEPEFVTRLLQVAQTSTIKLPSTLSKTDVSPLLQPLTQREQETLRLLATNLTIPEIAEELFVSVSTVRTYTKHIYSKLDVHSRIEAIHRAEVLGLLPPS